MARAMLRANPDMSRSFFWRLFASAAVFACLLCFASVARAQVALDINPTQAASLPRVTPDGKPVQKRINFTPEGVNYQDCLDDLIIQFPLIYSGFDPQSGVLEVWGARGGVPCETLTNQSGAAQQCWLLDTVDRVINPLVPIRVRKMMSGIGLGTAIAPKDDVSNCGKVDLSQISVQFIYYAGGNRTTPGAKKDITINFDTVGPEPPTGLKILPGNKRIQVQWASISGGDPDSGSSGGATALTGVRVYCDKESQVAPAAADCRDEPIDGGTTIDETGDASVVDAGTTQVCEDAGTTTATCGSAHLSSTDGKPLFPSAELDKYKCGELGGSSGTSVFAEGLENNVQYAIAVAGRDPYGNFGSLSPVTCETPEQTTDFWDEYRKAGGEAGGGCATSSTNAPMGTAAAALTAVAVLISSLTRRRKDR